VIEAANGEDTTKLVLDMLNQPPEIVAMLTALSNVKVPMIKSSGKVTKIKRGGRRISIGQKGKDVTAKVSGSRTSVYINGKKTKRKNVKVGMICTFTWPKVNAEAKKIDCKPSAVARVVVGKPICLTESNNEKQQQTFSPLGESDEDFRKCIGRMRPCRGHLRGRAGSGRGERRRIFQGQDPDLDRRQRARWRP
jgi:hypothetical protein